MSRSGKQSSSNGTSIPAPSNTSSQRFRQTRFTEHAEKMVLTIKDKKATVKNWSRTGIGFELSGDPTYVVGDSIEDVRIICGEITLFEGRVTVRFAEKSAGPGHYYGASFAGSLFLVDGVNAAVAAQDFVQTLEESTHAVEKISPEVCQSLVAIRSALRRIRAFCDTTEARWRDLSFDSRCEAERVLIPFLSRKVTALFTYFNLKVAKQIDVDSLKEGSTYHLVFAEEATPEFEQGDFPRRAYVKPRGYAGDYEMMNQLYRGGYEGTNLYGRVINYYVANESAGVSVRYRKDYFLDHFRDLLQNPGTKSVLSVACGPAVEIQELCKKTSAEDLERLFLVLFDLDREALEHAQTKIFETAMDGHKKVNIDFVNASVKTFLSSQAEFGNQFDLIYSAGLFDYLDNLTSAALVRHFSRMLLPGGKLVLGNFTKANPTKAFCHLILNWNLIHKTEEEIRGWADGLEGCEVSIEHDPQKINAFLIIKKNGASQ